MENTVKKEQYGSSLLLRMHPVQRISLSALFATAVWFFIKDLHENTLFILISTWSAFAFTYLLTSWIILFTRKVTQIKKLAKKEDGSRFFVMLFAIVASFAAMVTVLLLVTGKNNGNQAVIVPISFFSVLLSWGLVHTILTFHYAHLYYDDDKTLKKQNVEGLDFPGDKDPDYIDFAYFSFVVGMTFQVSDVQITNTVMRRVVLAHALISFLLNTFVVALTVNFIAGLSK